MINSDTVRHILGELRALPPWGPSDRFGEADWSRYIEVAQLIQQTDSQVVESALSRFVAESAAQEYTGYESESAAFILMRVVFDLPESAPEERRRSFKGWTNWPRPDAKGNVSLSWPLSWQSGRPALVASYEGSAGKPYAAEMEYRYFLERFRYRVLANDP